MKETTAKYVSRDEVYCNWYECLLCECDDIKEESNYCPNCGARITSKK